MYSNVSSLEEARMVPLFVSAPAEPREQLSECLLND